MTPKGILALAKRCRSRTVDRLLDEEIARVVGWWQPEKVAYGRPAWRDPAGNSWQTAPDFTRRIDWAIDVVPPKYPWALEVNLKQIAATVYSSALMERKWSFFARTPALALCGAGLMARAALIERGLK